MDLKDAEKQIITQYHGSIAAFVNAKGTQIRSRSVVIGLAVFAGGFFTVLLMLQRKELPPATFLMQELGIWGGAMLALMWAGIIDIYRSEHYALSHVLRCLELAKQHPWLPQSLNSMRGAVLRSSLRSPFYYIIGIASVSCCTIIAVADEWCRVDMVMLILTLAICFILVFVVLWLRLRSLIRRSDLSQGDFGA